MARSVTLADLAGEPIAETPPGMGHADHLRARCSPPRASSATPAFEINDISTILDLVRNDLAVALLPADVRGAAIASLVAVPVGPRRA